MSDKYEVVTSNIKKPLNDLREYKYIKLKKNNLEILFVQDFREGKSAAAVNVNAGSLQDPLHRQGLAHFLEHMLFLGTEKYPDADFDAFLNENSGSSNAYTDFQQTNFYFECSDSGFREGLDRFGNFFVNPLFNKDLVDREMNAVNSEYSNNLQDDEWRKQQLLCSSSLPTSELNMFGIGSLETLKHDSTRDDLIAFYKENYSANLIKVCIYTHEKIEEIEGYVIDLFEQIPNSNKPAVQYPIKPFPDEIFSSQWKYVPIKDGHSVRVMWTTDFFTRKSYKKHPLKYWSHIFGFEGENSLLSALKHLGLAEGLSSGYEDFMDNSSIFYIEYELTDLGIQKYEEVLRISFAFLKLLKEKGTQFYVFEEDRVTGEQEFNSQDQDDAMEYAHSLTSNMQIFSPEDVIKGTSYCDEYDPTLIQNTLNLFTADNMRIFISSPVFSEECIEVEKYFQSKYCKQPIPQSIRQLFQNPIYDPSTWGGRIIDLPSPNEFIAKDLSLIQGDVSTLPQYPQLIKEDQRSQVYFKQDNTFKVPKTLLKVLIHTRDCQLSENCENYLLAKLWSKLFEEQTREFVYQAEMAKIYTKSYLNTIIEIEIEGFSQTLPSYAQKYFTLFQNFNPALMEQEFSIELDKLKKKLKNYSKKAPYEQGKTMSEIVLKNKGIFLPSEKEKLVQEITFEKLCAFHEQWLKNLYLIWFVIGNTTRQSAVGLIESLEQGFFSKKNPLPREQIEVHTTVNIKSKNVIDFVWEKNLDEDEKNSFIYSIFQFENSSYKNEMIIKLIDNFIEEPFYSSLRTEQQLGYMVWSSTSTERTVLFVQFQIQSDVKPPQYLAEQIDSFIEEMLEEAAEMKQEDLDTIRESVETDLKEESHSLSQEASRFWAEIKRRRLQFDFRERQLEALNKITLKEFQQAFTSIFDKKRSNFQIHLVSKVHKEENIKLSPSKEMEEESNLEFVTDILEFKKSQPKHIFKYY